MTLQGVHCQPYTLTVPEVYTNDTNDTNNLSPGLIYV